MKDWRPHIDLARLSTALAEEILAADAQEMRDVSARTGRSLAGAGRDVRALIAQASDEPDKRAAVLVEAAGAPGARQH